MENRWERLGAAAGMVFVALMVVAQFIVPTPPRLSELDKIATYAADNRQGLLTSAYLNGLSAIFALWFIGSIRSTLRRAEGERGRLSSVAFGGGVAAVVVALFGALMMTEVAFRANQAVDLTSLRLLTDLSLLAYTAIWFPVAALVLATAVVSIRTGVLPVWHAAYGGILAVASAAGGALIYGSTGFFSLDKTFNAGFVLFLGFAVWALVTSVLLTAGEIEIAAPSTVEETPRAHWHLRRASGM